MCIMVLTPSNPSCPAGTTDSALVGLPFAPLATNATIVPPGGPTFKPLAAPPPPPQHQPSTPGESSSGLEAWKLAVAAAVPAAAVAAVAAVAAGVLLYRCRGRRGLYASTGGSSQSGKRGDKAGKEADGNLEEGSGPSSTISALLFKVTNSKQH